MPKIAIFTEVTIEQFHPQEMQVKAETWTRTRMQKEANKYFTITFTSTYARELSQPM